MESIFDFILLFLIYWGFIVVAYKYEIESVLNNLANKYSSRFIHKISECQFCIDHHIGVVIIPIFYLLLFGISTKDYTLLAVTPFIFSSLSNIIKTIRK